MEPPRYYGEDTKVYKDPVPGSTLVRKLNIWGLPNTSRIPFLHMVATTQGITVYYSHELKKRPYLREYIQQSGLDDELVQHVFHILTKSSSFGPNKAF